jgi:hypothetical protein
MKHKFGVKGMLLGTNTPKMVAVLYMYILPALVVGLSGGYAQSVACERVP